MKGKKEEKEEDRETRSIGCRGRGQMNLVEAEPWSSIKPIHSPQSIPRLSSSGPSTSFSILFNLVYIRTSYRLEPFVFAFSAIFDLPPFLVIP